MLEYKYEKFPYMFSGNHAWMPTCLLLVPQNNEFKLSKQVFRNEAHIILEMTLVQLLPIIFLDSDFCHNYLHTPVVLN